MTYKQRFKAYVAVLDTVTDDEITSYTHAEWATWMTMWDDFVVNGTLPPSGGDTPPTRPFHP